MGWWIDGVVVFGGGGADSILVCVWQCYILESACGYDLPTIDQPQPSETL